MKNFIIFINIIIKIYYDSSHKFINIFKNNIMYLRLYYGYKILKFNNHKLHNQCVSPFEILKKVGKLIYRLEFPSIIKIYSIIFIAQLKSEYTFSTSYKRRSKSFILMIKKNNGIINSNSNSKFYKIKTFFKKKIF